MSKAQKNTFRCQRDTINKLVKTLDEGLRKTKYKFNILELQMAAYILIRNIDMKIATQHLQHTEKK